MQNFKFHFLPVFSKRDINEFCQEKAIKPTSEVQVDLVYFRCWSLRHGSRIFFSQGDATTKWLTKGNKKKLLFQRKNNNKAARFWLSVWSHQTLRPMERDVSFRLCSVHSYLCHAHNYDHSQSLSLLLFCAIAALVLPRPHI